MNNNVFNVLFLELLVTDKLTLPSKWATLRPQELTPPQFIELTADLYGLKSNNNDNSELVQSDEDMTSVWRRTVGLFD